ncbi:MAG: hypothetical protein WCS72_06535, partial [Deltaproteobacteria bacterium]
MNGPRPTVGASSSPRLELRLGRGRVSVGFGPGGIGGGLALVDLELEAGALPEPLDPGAGTAPFRALPCTLRRLVVSAEGTPPGPDALAEVLAAALAGAGWPPPDTSGLVHATWSDGGASGASWMRPADAAGALLALARTAVARGEPDAALRLEEAGHAALAAGLVSEGEGALRAALEAGLGRDDAREAWRALVASARAAGDEAAERVALAGLVPAAPTGERPALLLRLSSLDLAAGDEAVARVHAEEAHTLAPRDRATTEACLAAAIRAGDAPSVIDLLDKLAVIDPSRAGVLLLERARKLAVAGKPVEADAAFKDAIGRLPPDRTLADEHSALRRAAPPPVGRLPWGEPLETFAGRAGGPTEASIAFRDAAHLARQQGDGASALRAARRAHALAGDLSFAGDLLAGLLHAGGSVVEALALHRQLLAEGAPALDPDSLADRLAALAELAEEAGDLPVALQSIDRLLELRPHDADLLETRFRLEPDRALSLDRLVAGASEIHSRVRRARLLARAAGRARDDGADPTRQRELLGLAAEAAAGTPEAEQEVAAHLLAFCRLHPSDRDAAAVLERALVGDARARAEALLSIAEAAPSGEVRAGHLALAAAALAEAGDTIGHRETVRAAFEAWPADETTFRGALAWAEGDADATDAILALRAVAVPAEAASCHRSRAELLLASGRPGPAARAFESCLASNPSDGAALEGLAEARASEGDAAGAVAAARRAAEVAAVEGRSADRRRVLERGAQLAARIDDRGDDAMAVLESLAVLLVGDGPPADTGAIEIVSRAATALDAAGEELRGASLRSRAGIAPPAPERAPLDLPAEGQTPAGANIAELLRPLLASARALADSGELGAAYARLKLAREIDPDHLDLTLMLARVAEKLGHLDEAVSLGESWGDAAARSDPGGAAARFRELAGIARTRLADPDRAAALLEKAVALEPDDPATAAALADLRASRRGQALEVLASHLDALRERPSTAPSARAVAVLSRELGAGEPEPRDRAARSERAAVADDLVRFGQQLGPAARALEPAFGITPEVRRQVALPGAEGPVARLLSALTPFLEPLFPVDLARHGVAAGDRLAPSSAPSVQQAFDAASRAISGRQLALFASKRPGLLATVENTRPPSVVLGLDAAALPPGALAFLGARSVALASAGWALVGR